MGPRKVPCLLRNFGKQLYSQRQSMCKKTNQKK